MRNKKWHEKQNERMAKTRTKTTNIHEMIRYAIANHKFYCYQKYIITIWKIRRNQARNQERCNLLIHVARCRTITLHTVCYFLFILSSIYVTILSSCLCVSLSHRRSLIKNWHGKRIERQTHPVKSNDRSKVWILFIVNQCVSIKWTIFT